MPLKKYPNDDEKTVCGSCPFFPTKVESIDLVVENLLAKTKFVRGEEVPVLSLCSDVHPQNIISNIFEAFYLDGKKESGATFPFPDSLSILQWTALDSIANGRNRAQNEYDRQK